MARRIVRNFVLATSAAGAIAVAGLALWTRTDDLVASYARGGNYRELRMGDWEISFSKISGWPRSESLAAGWAPDPAASMHTSMRTITLLDKLTIMASPTAFYPDRWNPIWMTGTADLVTPESQAEPEFFTVTSYPLTRYALPMWWVGSALSLPCWLTLFGTLLGNIKRNARRQRGQCAQCGYDLRGITSDRCPECGLRSGRN